MDEPVRRPREAGRVNRRLLWALVPGLLLGLAVAVYLAVPFWSARPTGLPRLEQLTVERVVLDDRGIAVLVQAGAAGPVRIAQVQVDGAFWEFAQDPLGALPPLSGGWLRIGYPWVFGEAHQVTIITSRGAVFQHRIPLAVPTVVRANLPLVALLGAGVGLLPLALAGTVLPVLGAIGRGSGDLVYAASVVLLLLVLVGLVRTALGSAAEAASVFYGGSLVWAAASATAAGLIAVGWLGSALTGTAQGAASAAVRLGAHRLCQGLAVGGAVAIGSVSLAIWLTLAFLLHNLLVGASFHQAVAGSRSRWARAALTVVAGLPPLAGAWLGGQAVTPEWAALALAAGAGAILQAVVGAGRFLVQRFAGQGAVAGRRLLVNLPALVGAMHLAG